MAEQTEDGDFTKSWRTFALVAGITLAFSAARWWGAWQAPVTLGGVLLAAVAAFWQPCASDSEHRRAVRWMTALGIGLFGLALSPVVNQWFASDWDILPRWSLVLRIAILGAASIPLVIVGTTRGLYQTLRVGVVSMLLIGGALTVSGAADVYTDVRIGHMLAQESIGVGDNPYSDLEIQDTAPAEWNQGTIIGYSYPPVTLIVYSAAEWIWDGRFATVLSLAMIAWLLSIRSSRFGSLGLPVAGLAVSIPVTAVVIVFGWTEPLQAALLIGAALLWRRPVAYGIVFGLAIASKQYMVLAVIPLISAPISDRWKRLGISAATATATLLPFFAWNPSAMWNALVAHQFDRPIRGDSTSIAAFGLALPIVVALVLAIVVGLIAGRSAHTTGRLLLAQAATLGVYFVLSPNSFANYWYLVATLVIAAVVVGSDPRRRSPADASSHVGMSLRGAS